ncbi:LOW QUALITY PROTEIN: UBN2 domain-containing protein, partial [Cephalotus follicularis]
VTYEGTNQVKEAKISMLVHEYKMFTMNENEDIKSMFSRFTNIINALALDKTYSNSEMDLLKKKKKAMIATWDDSDESSDEDSNEEVAQIALMALEEEEEEEESDEVTYDEL